MKPFILVLALLIISCSASGQTQHQTSFTTSPDNILIAYDVRGKGESTLVFVHGWSCDRSYWKGQLEPFSREFRVITIDLAGHGESGLGRKTWTMEAFGGDVASVVKKLGAEDVILIGHSMGGDVIAEAARQLPGRVACLVLVDTYKGLGPGRTEEEVQTLTAPFRANFKENTKAFVADMFLPNSDRALVERVAEDMSSAPPIVALGAMESALSYSREMPHALQELKLPAIAINPDNAPTDIESMSRYNVEVVLMPGVGHFLMMEDPERFNQLLKAAILKFTR